MVVDDWIGTSREAGGPCRFSEEDALALIGFNEVNLRDSKDSENKPRKSGAAAEIDEAPSGDRQKLQQLRAIQHMTAPQVVESRGGDKIDALLPFHKERGIGRQALDCFT